MLEGKNLTGTARYASIATHMGKEQSRRDDLETIGHVILYFMKGSLPWQNLPGNNKEEKYRNIKKRKLEISLDKLCEGLPVEIKEYMMYCRRLAFSEQPDYKYAVGLFDKVMLSRKLDPLVKDFSWKCTIPDKPPGGLRNSIHDLFLTKQKAANPICRESGINASALNSAMYTGRDPLASRLGG